MMEKAWDLFVDTLMNLFLPVVCSYLALTSSLFFNMADSQSTGLAKAADTLLIPSHYLFMGQQATQKEDGSWQWSSRFDYSKNFWPKTICAAIALPPSLLLGSIVKAISLRTETARNRYTSLKKAWRSTAVQPNTALYNQLNIHAETEPFFSENLPRRAGSEQYMASGKECLRQIAKIFNEAGIAWWIDCGTCLGAYRYGGVIPWDCDIDIAILAADFENVRKALNALDASKYIVQDWSSRDFPHSLFKVFVKETKSMIDIYNFDADLEKRELKFIFSLENNVFFPEWWKIRERRFKTPVAFATVFPLRKALFDGIEVFLPQDPKKYLQRYYGENLAPAKIYSAEADEYVKDLSHPYWQSSYVH